MREDQAATNETNFCVNNHTKIPTELAIGKYIIKNYLYGYKITYSWFHTSEHIQPPSQREPGSCDGLYGYICRFSCDGALGA